MNKWRKFFLLVLLCAGAQMAWSTAHAQSVLDDVLKRGVLRAGVKVDTPSFCFADEHSKPAGFDIDLIQEIARRLKVRVQYVVLTSATRVQALMQNKVDLIACTLTNYRDRDKVIDMTIGYLYTPQTLLVKKSSGITSVRDMAGKRLGTTIGAGTANYFTRVQPQAKVQTFEGWAEAFFALQRGLVDAVGTDMTILAGLRASASDPSQYVILGKPGYYAGSDYGLGIRQNDSKWRNQLDFLIQDIWTDGTWDKLFDKWLGPKSKLGLSKQQMDFQIHPWP